ncbi:MAG: hypothetical protein K6F56_05210 [Oscillospiraceae bacterium]|nr:hypothetical protein [Oscillospiraceae bacterium]
MSIRPLPPSFFRFGRGGRARSRFAAIDFADPAPFGPADSAKKERDLPDKTRFSGTFTKTAKLFCAKTTKGKSRN